LTVSAYSGGYCANVDITNNSSTLITNWSVVINFPAANLQTLWNGTYNILGTTLYVTSLAYNPKIAPGTTLNFGYCAVTTGPGSTPSIADIITAPTL